MKTQTIRLLLCGPALTVLALAGPTATANDDATRDNTYVQSVMQRAEAGDISAQYQAGILYQRGEGVPRADIVAAAWYRRAGEQDHAQAQHNLAVMYEQGDVLTRDLVLALGWYVRAADQGVAESQYNAGRIYEFGDKQAVDDDASAGGAGGVDEFPDQVRARMWYVLAAEQGFAPAIRALERITATMPEWAIAESERLAAEWRVANGG